MSSKASETDPPHDATKESVYPKSIIFVSEPEKIKILMDEVRLSILRVLREGIMDNGELRHEMTVREIAQRLGIKTPQKLYHHIDLLLEHGFLYPAREEKKKRSSITYYARTAAGFMVLHNVGESPEMKDEMSTLALSLLNAFGLSKDTINVNQLASALEEFHALKAKSLKTYIPLLQFDQFNEKIRYIPEIISILALHHSKTGHDVLSKLEDLLLPHLDKKLRELNETQ